MKVLKDAILLTVCIVMGVLSQAISQPLNRAGTGGPGIQYLITEYGADLQLSENQINELIALQMEQREKLRETDRRPGQKVRRYHRNANGNRNYNRNFREGQLETRLELRQEILEVLTDEQVEILKTSMIEKAEQAHEFRTMRHQYMVEQAGIEGVKADQVINLLNSQSTDRLQMDKQRIENPAEFDQEMWNTHFKKMRELDDQLQGILTVDEYRELRESRGYGRRGPGNGYQSPQRKGR